MPRWGRASGGLARGAVLGVAVVAMVSFGACSKSDEWTRDRCLERSSEVLGALPNGSDSGAQEDYARKLQDLNAELAQHKCLDVIAQQGTPEN